MEESFGSARPVAGRWVALDFRPARPLTLLGPLWAAWCGAVASGGLIFHNQWLLKLLLLFLLCDALLGAWRALWLQSDWRTALPHNLANARLWLMTTDYVPHSFIARVSRATSDRIRLVRTVVWPLIDSQIIGMIMAGVLAMCIAIVLGLVPAILTAVALTLALVEGQLGTERGMVLRAIFEIALPWFIAQSTFGYFSWMSLVFVLLVSLIYHALLALTSTHQSRWIWLGNLAHVGIIGLLLATNVPAGAAIVALGLLAQMLWQTRYRLDHDGRSYARRVQSYVMVGMFVASLSLWF